MRQRFSDRMKKERADSIVAEAITLLSEQGCCGLRVEDVARRAGVAKGTIYLDFQSREDLIEAALRRCGEELVAEMTAEMDPAATPRDRLRRAVGYLAALPAEHAELSPLLVRRMQCGGSGDHERPSPGVMPLAQIEASLAAAVREAGARIAGADDPELVAQAIAAVALVPGWQRSEDASARIQRAVRWMLGENGVGEGRSEAG